MRSYCCSCRARPLTAAPARATIQLGDIVPGEDHIGWRGMVTGPAQVSADWVRVREE